MSRRHTRVLSDSDVRSLLTMPDAIAVMRGAFVDLSGGGARVPVRQLLRAPEAEAAMFTMPAFRTTDAAFGVKIITLHDRNPKRGLPRSLAKVLVFDADNGDLIGLLDGEHLTAVRTGAGSGVATEELARRDSRTVAIFGGGRQAETQLEAVCAVRPIDTVYVYTRSEHTASAFAERMSPRLDVNIIPHPPRDRIRDADIICSATTSTQPVFLDEELGAGVHINGVGSYSPGMVEVPATTVGRSVVVVDQREAALAEAGDLIQAIAAGAFAADAIHAELGEVVAGSSPGRSSDAEVTFFKSVGNAIQDLAVASFLLARAEERDVGTTFLLR